MLLNSIKDYLFCSIKTNDHFVEDPLLLHCGHAVCKKCFESQGVSSLYCGICGKNTPHPNYENDNYDYESRQESGQAHYLSDLLLTENLKYAYGVVLDNFTQKFDKVKEEIVKFDDSIESKIEFAKDEIDVRVNSLKIQLDNDGDRLKSELDGLKATYKEWKNKNIQRFPLFDETRFKRDLENLKKSTLDGIDLNKKFLFECQDGIKNNDRNK